MLKFSTLILALGLLPNSVLWANPVDYYDHSGNKVSFEEFKKKNTFSINDLEAVYKRLVRGEDPGVTLTTGETSEKRLMSLAAVLNHSDYAMAMSAALLIGAFKAQDIDTHLSLVKALGHTDHGVQKAAEWALEKIKPQDNRVFLALLETLKKRENDDPSNDPIDAAFFAQNVFMALAPQDPFILQQLVAMYRENLRLRRFDLAGFIFLVIRPQNEEVALSLVKVLEENPHDSRPSGVLSNINPQSKKIHMAIADLMKSDNIDLVYRAYHLLRALNPKDQEVFQIMENCEPLRNKLRCG